MAALARTSLLWLMVACAGCFDFSALRVTDAIPPPGTQDGGDGGDGAATDGPTNRVLRPMHIDDPALLASGAEVPFPALDGEQRFYSLNTDSGTLRECGPEVFYDALCTGDIVADLPIRYFEQTPLAGEPVPPLAVLAIASFILPDGISLRVTGASPLVVLSPGPIRIDGELGAHASDQRPGPGGATGMGKAGYPGYVAGTECVEGPSAASISALQRALGTGECGVTAVDGATGGGGGGHGGGGGAGGRATARTSLVDDTLIALDPSAGGGGASFDELGVFLGGGGGGAGGVNARFGAGPDNEVGGNITLRAGGGHGGGAVQLTSAESVSIGPLGIISVAGARGRASLLIHRPMGDQIWGGHTVGAGGGGGAAGAIVLEAPRVAIEGTLFAPGGGGAGGDMTRVFACDGGEGNGDGHGGTSDDLSVGGAGGTAEVTATCPAMATEVPSEANWLAGNGGRGGGGASSNGLSGVPSTAPGTLMRYGGGGGGAGGRVTLRGEEIVRTDARIGVSAVSLTIDTLDYFE